ncbi:MAG: hypothetical protein SNJ77_12390 [Cytophagales bacterium]
MRFLFLLPFLVFSQGFVDIVRLESYYSPTQTKQGEKVNLSIGQAQLFLPIVKNEKNTVFFNPRFELVNIQFKDESLQLVQTAYPLGFKRNVNDRWGYTTIVIPRFNGPFDNSFQIGVLNTVNINNSGNLNQRFGFYANQEFFGLFLLPLYGIDWKINGSWRAYGLLPVNAAIENRKSEKLAYGISFNAFINSFRSFQTEKYPGYFQRNTNELYLYADYYLSAKLVLQGKVGYSVGRAYKYYPEDEQLAYQISLARFGDKRAKRDAFVTDGAIFQLNLVFRVKTDYK